MSIFNPFTWFKKKEKKEKATSYKRAPALIDWYDYEHDAEFRGWTDANPTWQKAYIDEVAAELGLTYQTHTDADLLDVINKWRVVNPNQIYGATNEQEAA